MIPETNDREPWPICGYGRAGLCCSACLLGPCRLSPFSELPTHSPCGRDADHLVSLHLHQMAALEAIQAIRSLNSGLDKMASERLRSLFPEGSFPHLSSYGFPPESLMTFFFEQLEPSGDVEEILIRTHCLSLISAFCRALAVEDDFREKALNLPSKDQPLLICLAEKESAGEAWVGRMAQALRGILGQGVQVAFASDPVVFPEIGRRIYRDRHVPVAFIKTLAIVSANSLSCVLTALALGFHVVSYPSLPIHGGPKVEAFFSKGGLKRFGGQYISGREDLSPPAILEELRWSM